MPYVTKSSLDLHKDEAIVFLNFLDFVLNENVSFQDIFYPRARFRMSACYICPDFPFPVSQVVMVVLWCLIPLSTLF